jgi:hypothetical protein
MSQTAGFPVIHNSQGLETAQSPLTSKLRVEFIMGDTSYHLKVILVMKNHY